MLWEIIKDYCAHSQFHGLRFVADDERHWIERLFWIACVCASWCGCLFVILSSLDAFQNNPLSFGTDTNYIDWNTSLFAVSVCEENEDVLYDKAPEILGDITDFNLYEVLKEITYFKGSSYFFSQFCFDGNLDCPKNGYKELGNNLRSSCNGIFNLCKWNNMEFDCCEYFQLLETEIGPCYSLDSIQVKNPKRYPLISNKNTGAGALHLELLVTAKVYIHSPEDVPTLNSIELYHVEAKIDAGVKRMYAITEIVNEREVKDVDIKQRRCRYPDESDVKSYSHYSYTACVVDCRTKKQLELCNCTNHFAPGYEEDLHCGLEGLRCLNDHYEEYSVVINSWTKRVGVVCSCLPGCSEPEYDLLDKANLRDRDVPDDVAVVEFSLERRPTIRLKRSVVRGRLDLVVSMGGICGLFVGASLLSFVEVVYFFTIRIYNSFKAKKPENKVSKPNGIISRDALDDSNLRIGNKNLNKVVTNMMASKDVQYPMRYLNSDYYNGYRNNYLNNYIM